MTTHSPRAIALVFLLLALGAAIQAAPLERVPATTLTMPASPPTFGYSSTNALGNLVFTNPVAITSPPGETNRLFILEKRGRIIVITNLAAPTRTIFMDVVSRVTANDTVGGEEGLLGLAFHPGYATNRYFYLFYAGNDNTTGTSTRHDILSRFTTSPSDPNQGMSGSELKIIRQLDQASNHNGGDVHFGPDGYLYVSLGDEGDSNDTRNNSQIITNDFFSAILRIDVDNRPGNLSPNPHAAVTANYRIPWDNPYVHTNLGGSWNGTFNGALIVNLTNVRSEFWAVGQRNPWRMSFDPQTGMLYCGDVGQNAGTSFEEVDIVVRGGNYGWAFRHGLAAGPKSAQAPANFDNLYHNRPLFSYATDSSTGNRAIVGGVKYYGQRLSQLYGAYIYGDYASGRIWALRHNGNTVTQNTQILQDAPLSCFGIDPSNGDVLYAHIGGGMNSTIKRINYNTTPVGAPLPATLAATGAFADPQTLTPNAGIVPYDINVPFWSDNAHKQRWFSLPNTNLTFGFNREGNLTFPNTTVWVKHFELELTNGVPESNRRLETRFLVKNTAGAYGVTYRWGDSLTNATLVPEGGTNEIFVLNEGGILRTQVWEYPSRVACIICHTPAGGFALGFNTAQLNRDFDYGGTITNQIAALSQAGYFTTNVPDLHTLRALAHPADDSVSLEYRVRSYLAVNCVQCHQPAGTAPTLWDARLTTSTANAGLVNGALINSGDDANNRMLVPGNLSNSMLLSRIATRGPGQMPPLTTSLVDTQAVELIAAWITNDLPSFQFFADWQLAWFGATNSSDAGPLADPDGDGANNKLEALTGTNPTNSLDAWRILILLSNDVPVVEFPQIANRGFEVQSASGLFGSTWTPLNVSANAPFFAMSNRNASVPDNGPAGDSKYYRVRVFEP